jgi:plastocyanin
VGKRAILLALATIAVASVAALGVAQAAPAATITVGNNFLSPSSKTISAGTKLRFKWVGGITHKIVKAKGPGGEIRSPETSARGVNLSKVLRKRGTYRFRCVIHPTEMKTKVVVR